MNMRFPLFCCISFLSIQQINAQWSTDPALNTLVCNTDRNKSQPTMAPDGQGGIFIAFHDSRNDQVGIYAQHLDSDGNALWVPNGIKVGSGVNPKMISDGQGGAIIVWRGGITMQRIDGDGNLLWGESGLTVGSSGGGGTQREFDVISNGAGGAVVAWRIDSEGNPQIVAQQVNANGERVWTPDEVPVCVGTWGKSDPRIASDGSGGAIISWLDPRFNDKGKFNVVAQRITAAGTRDWANNGIPVCAQVFHQQHPDIVSDGAGGAIIAWEDFRDGARIYAQRINGNGNSQWASSGILVSSPSKSLSTNTNTYDRRHIGDGNGGAIFFWRVPVNDDDVTIGFDYYCQRLSATGVKQWGLDGKPVLRGTNFDINEGTDFIGDGNGGALFFWHDYRNGSTNSDVFGQYVGADGAARWQDNGIVIANPAGHQKSVDVTSDGFAGFVVGWRDINDGGANDHVYVQNVNVSGGLGGQILGSVSGVSFNDLDEDGVQSVGEIGMADWIISVEPGDILTRTDEWGFYRVGSLSPSITYTVTQLPRDHWLPTVPNPSSHSVTPVAGVETEGKNFGSKAASDITDLSVSMAVFYPAPLTSPCCGQEMTFMVRYGNDGTVAVDGSTISVQYSPHAVFSSYIAEPTLPSMSLEGTPVNSVTWELPTPFQPGASGIVYLTLRLSGCEAPANPAIVTIARIDPDQNDADQTNNHTMLIEKTECSFDPNDKAVDPRGCGPAGLIGPGLPLSYRIRFQNTGNAPAHRVIVRDTLDDDLDPSTLELLGAGHVYTFARTGRELVWTFPDIELPDSNANEPASHGYIDFKVSPVGGSAAGTEISNRAGIYFDLNEPVITNATLNTLSLQPFPVAGFTSSVDTLLPGEPASFSYTGGSTDPTFSWNFGSGAIPPMSTDASPSGISWTVPGRKVVTLEVTLGECVSEPDVREIYVRDTLGVMVSVELTDRWNLVSPPVRIADMSGSGVFPSAISPAYAYVGNGYAEAETLVAGRGYWMKFSGNQTFSLYGEAVTCDTIELMEGWNLVGGISFPVNAGSIPGVSSFYGYRGAYYEAVILYPGESYWVKSMSAQTIQICENGPSREKRR